MSVDEELLAMTRVTKDMGATIKPGPMVVAGPDQVVTDAQFADVAAGSGLNGPFLADLVVSMAAHESMAINMYRALRTSVANPMLKTTFARFEQDSMAAVAVHLRLMDELGIPAYYISPAARMTEGLDGHMIMSMLGAGSADPLTIDLKAVEMVLLGSTMCVANTNLLREIGARAEDGAARLAIEQAVSDLAGAQLAHLEWATTTQQRMVLAVYDPAQARIEAESIKAVIAKLADKMP